MKEGFSNDPQRSSESEREAKEKASWEKHGSFVPEELRVVADDILNMINESIASLGKLSEENQTKFVELLQEYQELPSYGPGSTADKGKVRREIEDLLNQ